VTDTILPADINPIGSISKTDLKKFIAYAQDAFDLPVLERSAHCTCHGELGTDVTSGGFQFFDSSTNCGT
jgi:hypothetical protein